MVKKDLKKYWLVLVFLLVFLLRLPSLFEPFTYGDEGIYLTLGQAARQGLVWYRDIHDNKPPMLYLMAALAGDFPTYRLILFLWSFITIFVFYKLSQALFGKNQSAIIAPTTAFAILTSSHTFEGNIGNAENFMLLPTIVAFFLIYHSIEKKKTKEQFNINWFFAGVLLSLAALFKIPAAFDLAAALVFFFLVLGITKKKNYKLLITNYFLLLLGFILPILVTIIYYASKGALDQYLTSAFFQNIPYLSSWAQNKLQVGGLPLSLLSRGFLVLALVSTLLIFGKKVALTTRLILVWFAFSWFAALLSSRPYPHYLIQVLPPLSLSFGLFYNQPKKYLKEKFVPIFLLACLIISWIVFRFWYYANLPYYFNFYQYALRLKSQEKYFSDFDPHSGTIYQTASHLRSHTLTGEKIFIWGTEPYIYALSKRLPVGRYTATYHIVDFNGFEETIRNLKTESPRYIIIMASEKTPFPELKSFVAQNYALEKTIGESQIFHRLF